MQRMTFVALLAVAVFLVAFQPVGRLSANPVLVEPNTEAMPIHRDNPIQQLGSGLVVESPYHHKNLWIFPLSQGSSNASGREATRREFLTLDRAIDQGVVEVKEKGSGEVNTVQMRNKGKSYVFGLAGDMIIGAKQDRMLQHDVLLPPESGWLAIEVYCTEHGRWQGATEEFHSTQRVVPGMVRAKAAQTESQHEVWAGVAEAKEALGDQAGTSALGSIYSDRELDEKSQAFLDALKPVPIQNDRTIGALVAVGDRILCLDVFGSRSLFQDMWDKLLRSYVMDALSRSDDGRLSTFSALEFVRSLSEANLDRRSSPGSGRSYRVTTNEGSGSGLVFDDRVVHLDLFPDVAHIERDYGGDTPNLDFRRNNR
jgi:hypothetical protein